jgi:hypothetical protein
MLTQMSRRLFVTAGPSLPLMGFSTADSLFAPKAKALPGCHAFTKGSPRRVDHSACYALLAKHGRLDSAGTARMNYGGFSSADMVDLTR